MQHIPLDFLNNALKALVSIFLKKNEIKIMKGKSERKNDELCSTTT
jgi:hypothetical protein